MGKNEWCLFVVLGLTSLCFVKISCQQSNKTCKEGNGICRFKRGYDEVDDSFASLNDICKPTEKKKDGARQFEPMDNLPTDFKNKVDVNSGLTVANLVSKKEIKTIKHRNSMSGQSSRNPYVRDVYKYKERLDKSEPKGCGYPICVEVDMTPKRFRSMCEFADWLKENNMVRRVFTVQKQDCQNIIAGKTKDRKKPWARSKGKHKQCTNHYGCNTQICVNADGNALTFDNVRKAMLYLRKKKTFRNKQVITVALGKCSELYTGCIFTEWFDLDDPASDNKEQESVAAAHDMVLSSDPKVFDKTEDRTHLGIHRSCAPHQIQGPAEFVTTDGDSFVRRDGPGGKYSKDHDSIRCFNKNNDVPLPSSYSWKDYKKNITCRDWKIRYCCKNLWGKPTFVSKTSTKKKGQTSQIQVEPPERKDLFQGCKWGQFLTASAGGSEGDKESKDVVMHIFRRLKRSLCHGCALDTRFIDVRTNQEGTPYDETGEDIVKISPSFGFFCDAKQNGGSCKNYKVRYCCVPLTSKSQWGPWKKWSKCSKSCGGGVKQKSRVCYANRRLKTPGKDCFKPHEEYENQEAECNLHACPGDFEWAEWKAWTDCSVSCGKGTRKRNRNCIPDTGGKPCPKEKGYKQVEECRKETCKEYQWAEWSEWAGCSKECGVTSKSARVRKCISVHDSENTQCENRCQGLGIQKNGSCPFIECKRDGQWGPWLPWEACSLNCGDPKKGKRVRRRDCANPFPKMGGRECPGKALETGPCKDLQPCPQNCEYSRWGEWGSCAITCGTTGQAKGSFRQRNRCVLQTARHGGVKCDNVTVDLGSCIHCDELKMSKNKKAKATCIKQCPVDCVLKEWGPWNVGCRTCYKRGDNLSITRTRSRYVESDTVGDGKPCKVKGREVTMKDGIITDKSECVKDKDVPKCPKKTTAFWGCWEQWSACHNTKCKTVYGKKTRNRVCNNKKKNEPCKGKGEQTKKCVAVCGDPYSPWTSWTQCTVTCGIGTRRRKQKCKPAITRKRSAIKHCTFGKVRKTEEKCDMGSCVLERYEDEL